MHSRKSQAQIIVTVLLILIVLTAVAFVGTFVTNLIKENLKGTDCFKTLGQVSINKDFTYHNSTSNITTISITRGTEEFNLTGLSVSLSAGATAKNYEILEGKYIANELAMYGEDISSPSENITFPGPQETLTYQIKVAGVDSVQSISIAPIIGKGQQCDIVAETSV